MTHNELVGKIAARAKELADMTADQLRMEHPDAANHETPNQHNANQVLKGKTRGTLIEEILDEEFCQEFDFDIQE